MLFRSSEGEALLPVCRRLIEGPFAQPEHAARLAGAVAADDPVALDFLWTLYVETTGSPSEAARRALATIVPSPKSERVRVEIYNLLDYTDDPARRDILRTLLGTAGP